MSRRLHDDPMCLAEPGQQGPRGMWGRMCRQELPCAPGNSSATRRATADLFRGRRPGGTAARRHVEARGASRAASDFETASLDRDTLDCSDSDQNLIIAVGGVELIVPQLVRG